MKYVRQRQNLTDEKYHSKMRESALQKASKQPVTIPKSRQDTQLAKPRLGQEEN